MTLRPFVAFALLAGCKGTVLTRIDIDGAATTTVQGATLLEQLVGDLGFDDFVSMNLVESEELANQGVEPGDIEEARLVSFELEAVDPVGADLSFIDEMTLTVESPDLDTVQVAAADAFPEGEALVAFAVSDVDLTDYIVSESMTLGTDVTGQRPDDTTTVEARYVIEVGVTLQGATRKRD